MLSSILSFSHQQNWLISNGGSNSDLSASAAKKKLAFPRPKKFTKCDDTLCSQCKPVIMMTVTTNEHGQQNMWAKEPTMYYENYGMLSPNEVKEQTNGRWAMVGIVAGFISYAITGKLFFGIF